jgi:Tat protein translocase TatC
MPHIPDPSQFTMSFGDHLEDLRKRLLMSIVFPLPVFIGLFFVSEKIIGWILLPAYRALEANGFPPEMQVLSPPEFILAQLKISFIGALVLTAPWILYQAWLFVAPGLYTHERRFIYVLLPGSAILTVAGVTLLYWVMLPLMLHVLVAFGANLDVNLGRPMDPAVKAVLDRGGEIETRALPPASPSAGDIWLLVPELKLQVALPEGDAADAEIVVIDVMRNPKGQLDQRYRISFVIDFTLLLLLGIIVAFQLPLVLMLLGWMGLATAPGLRSQRRMALAICGLASAILTPADAVSMVMMLVPLYGLYELGILLVLLLPASVVAEGRFAKKTPTVTPKPTAVSRDEGDVE